MEPGAMGAAGQPLPVGADGGRAGDVGGVPAFPFTPLGGNPGRVEGLNLGASRGRFSWR